LLLHTHHPSLGINREVVFDWAGYQGLVAYDHVSTVPDLIAYYRSLGVTHVLYVPGEWPAPSRKEEALFHRFALDHAAKLEAFGPYRLLEVPEKPSQAAEPMTVATLGMPGYSDGLYALQQLSVNEYLPVELRAYPPPQRIATNEAERIAMLHSADAVFVNVSRAHTAEQTRALREFHPAAGYAGLFNLYLRRTRPTGSVAKREGAPETPSESPPVRGADKSGAAPVDARSAPGR
jgi:hypothetical protein